MSDQAVLLPKWSPNGRIILAKGQLNNSNTFWTMSILKFGLVYFFSIHPLCLKLASFQMRFYNIRSLCTFFKKPNSFLKNLFIVSTIARNCQNKKFSKSMDIFWVKFKKYITVYILVTVNHFPILLEIAIIINSQN